MRYKLIYQNDIGSVEFSLASGIIVEKVASLTQQNVGFETTKSNRMIGEKLEHQQVQPKTMTIRGTIMGEADAVRQQMVHVISPLSEGRLIFNDEYELTVYVKAAPDVERYKQNAKFNFSLYAPYPYWQKKTENSVTLVGLKALFSFPWNISDPNPFMFSEYVPVGYVNVRNEGESPAYWTVRFLALNEVTNPRVYNMETGEYVRILKTLADGEQLEISTQGEELTITVTAADGTVSDGFSFLDIESIPFLLEVGDNYIKTDADIGVMALRARISYRQTYVGV